MDFSTENGIFRGYLTKRQVAEMLGKSEHTLDRWHRLCIGPVRTKIGSTVLYRDEALRAWLLAQEKAQLQRVA